MSIFSFVVAVDDNQEPPMDETWSNFKIDFMTGDNNHQKFLKSVAKNLDASQLTSYNWTAPKVEPHSAIYFFMFTNDKGENAWTTRFAITGDDEKVVEPEKSVQSDGSKIPWGVGRIVTNASSFPLSNVAYSMTPAMASAAEKNAAVVIAVSNDSDKIKMISSVVILFTSILLSLILL
ncbi:hypothetical protein INT47_003675 [Mucor saturninus]|uniref:Yeast cell wall synthesis Kre9/Knh1-like N-terminal domain-containing protein n=1 Tax=Mucor saturninus TaxID=64648 RepID=A0A8H7R9Q1_9FUNG|nr:hypothetical protein INT47_003675 [Mucor saturninus]